jgi:valyl-tRNA synthetase
MYDFLWSEFADWYIEISKHSLYTGNETEKQRTRQILVHVMDISLRLLHPYMPFVTEEIWQRLPHRGEALMLAAWPQFHEVCIDEEAEANMLLLIDLVRGIRNLRIEHNVDPGNRIHAIIAPGNWGEAIGQHRHIFSRLCNVAEIRILPVDAPAPPDSAALVVKDVTVYLPLTGLVDTEAEYQRLTKESERLKEQIAKTQSMLNNDNFISRAPSHVVERERNRLTDLEASIAQIAVRLEKLRG